MRRSRSATLPMGVTCGLTTRTLGRCGLRGAVAASVEAAKSVAGAAFTGDLPIEMPASGKPYLAEPALGHVFASAESPSDQPLTKAAFSACGPASFPPDLQTTPPSRTRWSVAPKESGGGSVGNRPAFDSHSSWYRATAPRARRTPLRETICCDLGVKAVLRVRRPAQPDLVADGVHQRVEPADVRREGQAHGAHREGDDLDGPREGPREGPPGRDVTRKGGSAPPTETVEFPGLVDCRIRSSGGRPPPRVSPAGDWCGAYTGLEPTTFRRSDEDRSARSAWKVAHSKAPGPGITERASEGPGKARKACFRRKFASSLRQRVPFTLPGKLSPSSTGDSRSTNSEVSAARADRAREEKRRDSDEITGCGGVSKERRPEDRRSFARGARGRRNCVTAAAAGARGMQWTRGRGVVRGPRRPSTGDPPPRPRPGT
ncbi:hypothetical protein THAOC_25538, partial [Thalassiosira oceanica]